LSTAKCLRRQAAQCATLAAESFDEDARVRYERLQQTFLQLAETEDPHSHARSGGDSPPLNA